MKEMERKSPDCHQRRRTGTKREKCAVISTAFFFIVFFAIHLDSSSRPKPFYRIIVTLYSSHSPVQPHSFRYHTQLSWISSKWNGYIRHFMFVINLPNNLLYGWRWWCLAQYLEAANSSSAAIRCYFVYSPPLPLLRWGCSIVVVVVVAVVIVFLPPSLEKIVTGIGYIYFIMWI